MREQLLETQRGGILYEPSLLEKSGQEPGEPLFERLHWIARQTAVDIAGGRASVMFIRETNFNWVLRHYRRGGLIGKLLTDRYVWLGRNLTRSFREWRLLAHLHAAGLAVPTPVAARYVRNGLTYTADLLTEELPNARSLAQLAADGELDGPLWSQIGAAIAQFHRAGAHHPDLNAHNILIDVGGRIFVLDFDRGRLRTHGSWQNDVLDRLLRSLRKLKAQRETFHFDEENWRRLLDGYRRRLDPRGRFDSAQRPD